MFRYVDNLELGSAVQFAVAQDMVKFAMQASMPAHDAEMLERVKKWRSEWLTRCSQEAFLAKDYGRAGHLVTQALTTVTSHDRAIELRANLVNVFQTWFYENESYVPLADWFRSTFEQLSEDLPEFYQERLWDLASITYNALSEILSPEQLKAGILDPWREEGFIFVPSTNQIPNNPLEHQGREFRRPDPRDN